MMSTSAYVLVFLAVVVCQEVVGDANMASYSLSGGCHTGQCVGKLDGQCHDLKMVTCDGEIDCYDGSDEAACNTHEECIGGGIENIRCTYNTLDLCISNMYSCDGHVDCDSGIDETNCDSASPEVAVKASPEDAVSEEDGTPEDAVREDDGPPENAFSEEDGPPEDAVREDVGPPEDAFSEDVGPPEDAVRELF